MAMSDTDTKLKRKRGRPSTAKAAPQPTEYGFPSLDDILRLTDAQVLASFEELGVEPSAFRWRDEDDQWNVALWADYPISMFPDDPKLTPPMDQIKTDDDIQKLKATAWSIHKRCLRTELLKEHLEHWAATLNGTQLIKEVERLSEEQWSESQIRYAKKSDLQQQVQHLVWPELIKASTLYVPVESPFTK